MALLDKSKASSAFKLLQGKAHTSNLNELANEAIASGVTMSAQRIFADAINPTPGHASNTGIVSAEVILVLEAVAGSDTGQIGTPRAYRTKLGGSVPASLVGKTNPLTNAPYAINDYIGGIIPQSFGTDFRPRLYSDAAATVEIPPSSAADWFIDCFAGIVTQEGQDEGASGFTLGANGRVRAYIYIGQFVSEALGAAGAVNFFEGNGITVEEVNQAGTAGYAVNLGGTLTQETMLEWSGAGGEGYINIDPTQSGGVGAFDMYIEENTNGGYSEIYFDKDVIQIDTYDGATSSEALIKLEKEGNISLDSTLGTEIRSRNFPIDANFKGAYYDQDYAAYFTERTLVDKAYVDNAITSGTITLLDGNGTTAVNGGTNGTSINLGGTLTDVVAIAGPYEFSLNSSGFSVVTNAGPADIGIQLINPTGTGSFQIYHGANANLDIVSSGDSTGFNIGHYGSGNFDLNSNSDGYMHFQKNGGGELAIEKNGGTGNVRIQQNGGDEDLHIINTSSNNQGIHIESVGTVGNILIETNGGTGDMLLSANGGSGNIRMTSADIIHTLSDAVTIRNNDTDKEIVLTTDDSKIRLASRGDGITLTQWTSLTPTYIVRLASTEDIDLTTGGLVKVDSLWVEDVEEVLVMSQTDPIQNGLYNVNAAGSWTRSSNPAQNEIVLVRDGNRNANRAFVILDTPVYDTDPINFTAYTTGQATVEVVDGVNIKANGDGIQILENGGGGIQMIDEGQGSILITSDGGGITLSETGGSSITMDASAGGGFYAYSSNSGLEADGTNMFAYGQRGTFQVNGPNLDIFAKDAGNNVKLQFRMSDTVATFTDTRTSAPQSGIQYGADYSANYTNRSLVDKGYVLSQIGIAGTAGIATASNGLTKVGQDVRLGGALTQNTTINAGAFNFEVLFNDGVNSSELEQSDAGFYFDAYNAVDGTYVDINPGYFDVNINSNLLMLVMDQSSHSITFTNANGDGGGVKYAADYSASYTNRSLVDRGYVLTQIGQAGTNGIATASNGLTKVGQDVKLGGNLTENTLIDGFPNNNTIQIRGGASVELNTYSSRQFKLDSSGSSILDGSGGGLIVRATAGSQTTYTTSSITSTAAGGDVAIGVSGGVRIGGGSNTVNLLMSPGSILLTDGAAGKGIEYAADYSANYTDRSLVDKAYVDMVAQGLDPKASVRVATTTYITLSGLQTIDGVALNDGDRVLVKDQGTSGQANGIYTASAGAWTRSSDFDGTPSAEVTAGAYTFVTEGDDLADTGWVLATNDPITVGVTSLSFVQFSAAGQFTASNGLTKVGNDVQLGGSLTEDTVVNGAAAYDMTFTNVNNFVAEALNNVSLTGNAGNSFITVGTDIELTTDANIIMNADVNIMLSAVSAFTITAPSSTIDSDDVQIGTGNGLVEMDGTSVELYAPGSEMVLNGVNASLAANNSVTVDAPLFVIDSGVTRILNALTSSTSGYDVVVRNTVTGNLEKVASSTFTGSVPTLNNKYMTPSAGTGGNGNATGLTITSTPTADSYVQVEVNGIGIYLGTSSIIGDGYFAAPGTGGVIGRAIADIQAGDEFYWNSINAGFSLDALDHVDFLYSV